ncbi:sodium-dependent glucose transporter 1 [Engraulis encrasicolus]|uniref:sodium-dependent glucose transporter 1 n=1 Tax=Engraulis encrasicolus TaxID=184585 RepID=UPI002FD58C7D
MNMPVNSQPVVKKKHVRFASMEDEDDNVDDQEEDTLFDKRKDARKGLRSMIKSNVNKTLASAGLDGVKIISGGRRANDPGACGRWMVSLTLCASFLGLGMCISVLGPTLEDLAINVNKNISNISYIFVGRSAGYIGGSLVGGLLFDCMNPHLLLGFSMLVTAFGMIAIPFCKKALFLTGLMSCVGVSMGFLDTGGNVLILSIWGSESGPHMQALHFSFAAGAFFSPIIAKLLFGKYHGSRTLPGGGDNITAELSSSSASSATIITDKVAETLDSMLHLSPVSGGGEGFHSLYAYFVIAALLLLISLAFVILYSCGTPTQPDRSHPSPSDELLAARHHVALVCLLAVFFFWYVGAEVTYGSFIFTYAKEYAGMAQAQAAGLNALFWGTFAATRGLAIFFAACMRPGTMILLSLVGCTFSSLLLVLFSRSGPALWSCTALYGASMATVFPSGLSWLEQYTLVTGRSAAVFVVGAALGEMVLPAALGFLLGKPNLQKYPLVMLLALGSATITSILFPVMYKLAAAPTSSAMGKRPRTRGREADDEYRQALLDSGADDEEEEEEEEEEQEDNIDDGNEADNWNDADFEVIEMDDANLMSSPSRAAAGTLVSASVSASPPDVTVNSSAAAAAPAPSRSPLRLPTLAESPSKYAESSPRQKQLLAMDREKND